MINDRQVDIYKYLLKRCKIQTLGMFYSRSDIEAVKLPSCCRLVFNGNGNGNVVQVVPRILYKQKTLFCLNNIALEAWCRENVAASIEP